MKPIDEHFERAFQLAYFINGSKPVAISIVIGAMNKLEVAAMAQFKRLYYTPARRAVSSQAKTESHRTKVSLSELHLLQRLIYIESEPYERAQEQSRSTIDAPGESQMLVRFIKHLVRVAIKRNSFYVTLGISRLLHNYSTAETMEIYNVAVQDPERVKDDYYYRSRKGRLIQELKERFGERLNVCRGPRGEERFQTRDSPVEYVELVKECLNRFSPWSTPCPVPTEFDPTGDEIRALAFSAPEDEDKVEINRIHAILHPDCYGRITKALKLDLPEGRLSIPYFHLPGGENDMNGHGKQHRRSTLPLDAGELESIKDALVQQSARRKTTHAALLSITVDGKERARLDLKRCGSVNLSLEDGDELIEVRALDQGQEILLATHMLGMDETSRLSAPVHSQLVLEGGQKLSFTVSPATVSPAGQQAHAESAAMTIAYEETGWFTAASLALQRVALRLSELSGAKDGRARSLVQPALAGLLLMLCAGLLILFIARGRSRTQPAPAEMARAAQPQTINAAETTVTPSTPARVNALSQTQSGTENSSPIPKAAIAPPGPTRREKDPQGVAEPGSLPVKPSARLRALPQPPDSSRVELKAGRERPPTENASPVSKVVQPEGETTRAIPRPVAATSLSRVRKIYLEISGDQRLGQHVGALLSQSLREGQRLVITADRDEADAALKLDIRQMSSGKAVEGPQPKQANGTATTATGNDPDGALSTIVMARLVNEDGAVIWPTKNRRPEARYTGRPSSVAVKIARELLEDIRKSDARK